MARSWSWLRGATRQPATTLSSAPCSCRRPPFPGSQLLPSAAARDQASPRRCLPYPAARARPRLRLSVSLVAASATRRLDASPGCPIRPLRSPMTTDQEGCQAQRSACVCTGSSTVPVCAAQEDCFDFLYKMGCKVLQQ
ncbi:Phospho-N-acetylmuramoyl-pentapeptide-transferase-like protein [Zea mays]|uniref:Phospho-N-acetylmuramoyl-pentapeptide-transferase-like protein n=1 Tax=Zea mays TaxID=4577 RepID=A0A1D6MG53_MAIZE|nr:Phospho-N-acetylmuramoyl-pentapeptide-transferase-like protein [Zea mays]ONM28528.1 Phospho-N-acetylmuramoyl-pentapeptide-transferase-like protein [Zea mays]ONM28533.1 Phospho-N-acetylmuramoyl-pentapeptide-transferase-like protein [Zea mays]ONM28540.1 Phospho-N-acetylmuramoyl-pentapeptide-transferase-like protein [Zea mays]